MRCLANPELTSWLRDRSIPQEPYDNKPEQSFYLQFAAPRSREALQTFLTAYYDLVIRASESVAQLVEWIQSESPGDRVLTIRKKYGDSRNFSEAPSHQFDPDESELAVEIVSTAVFGSLSTYVYTGLNRSTLYLWEGEICDFWTDSREVHDILLTYITGAGLNQMEDTEQAAP